MTTKRTLILLLVIFTFSTQTHSQEREIINLNTAWKFSKGHNEMAHQKTIDDFKTAMVTTSSKFKAKYENQVLTLEQKNIELMKKLNDYQYKGKENWEEFKRGFNDDIYLVENSLKDIFAKKE